MKSILVNAVGDVWFGDHPVCIGHGIRSTKSNSPPHYIFNKVKMLLADADINFCNLESVVSDAGLISGSLESIEMRASPGAVHDLQDAGFNVVSIANNHIMQHGVEAYEDTLENLKKANINVVGLDKEGGTNIHFFEKEGIHVAILSFSMRPEGYYEGTPLYSFRAELQPIIDEIAALRQEFDGFILCSVHWGCEFLDQPSPDQRVMARRLADAGVDVLLGSHPHVWQGVERINNSVILYSMGNFVFDLWQENCRASAITHLELQQDGIINYKITPIWINDGFQPELPSGRRLAAIGRTLDDINRRLNSEQPSQQEYERMAEEVELGFRYSSYRYFLRNIYRYPLPMLIQSLSRTVSRIVRRLLGLSNQ